MTIFVYIKNYPKFVLDTFSNFKIKQKNYVLAKTLSVDKSLSKKFKFFSDVVESEETTKPEPLSTTPNDIGEIEMKNQTFFDTESLNATRSTIETETEAPNNTRSIIETETEAPNDTRSIIETETETEAPNATRSITETEMKNKTSSATEPDSTENLNPTTSVLITKITKLVSETESYGRREKFIRLEPSISGLINAAVSDKADNLLYELRKNSQKGKNI